MQLSLARPLAYGVGVYNADNPFGARPETYKDFGLAGHNGIDYIVAVGAPVFSMYPGRVVKVAEFDLAAARGGYGVHVVIENDIARIVYAHLSVYYVKVGQVVGVLHQIGLSGNTGNSTGPHLHVTLKLKGMLNPAYQNAIDPVIFRDGPAPSGARGIEATGV
jgi:murein DD-endopeptidase MepM/ murein hydrolase activator NlpD